MAKRKKNKRILIPLGAIITAVILLIVLLNTSGRNLVSSLAGTVVTPVQRIFSGMDHAIAERAAYKQRIKDVDNQNKELKESVVKLESQNRDYQVMKQENERLKAMLDFKDNRREFDLIAAKTVANELSNWFNMFTINKGTASGIKLKAAVLTPSGLVGHISEIGPNWAKVKTILDPTHSVSGIVIRESSQVQIDGDLKLMDDGKCKLINITKGANVIIGDSIETSGFGGVFPAGIFVGTVVEFGVDQNGERYAVLSPGQDFQRINEVFVVKPN